MPEPEGVRCSTLAGRVLFSGRYRDLSRACNQCRLGVPSWSVAKRVDFSPNTPVYDVRHGALLPESVAHELTAGLRPGARILDIGAGTGRVSVALGQLGFDMVAIEPAIGMLQALLEKAGSTVVRCILAEGSQLPLRGQSFDAVVISRLLYLVTDWKVLLRAASTVLTPNGMILHEWGNGRADEDWVRVRERARELFEESGVLSPFHPGARTEQEVDEHLSELGLHRIRRVAAGPGLTMSLSSFLGKIESGEISYIWNIPQGVRDECLPRLRAWAEGQFDLERQAPIPTGLEWSVFKRYR